MDGWWDIGVTFTPGECAELLSAAGVDVDANKVLDFAWYHEGWFDSWGRITACGNLFVGLSGCGLVFREAGVRRVLDVFTGGGN